MVTSGKPIASVCLTRADLEQNNNRCVASGSDWCFFRADVRKTFSKKKIHNINNFSLSLTLVLSLFLSLTLPLSLSLSFNHVFLILQCLSFSLYANRGGSMVGVKYTWLDGAVKIYRTWLR